MAYIEPPLLSLIARDINFDVELVSFRFSKGNLIVLTVRALGISRWFHHLVISGTQTHSARREPTHKYLFTHLRSCLRLNGVRGSVCSNSVGLGWERVDKRREGPIVL